jgi:integrase
MASIYRKTVYRKGKKCKAKKYTIKYKDETGQWRTSPGSTSYDLSQKLAAQIEYEVECRRRGIVDQNAEAKLRPLAKHLEDFTSFLTYDNEDKHVKLTMNRINSVLAACNLDSVAKLTATDSRGKVADYLKARLDGGLSATSCNHYLTAVKNFLILLIPKLKVLELKRVRRALTEDEFSKLIKATRKAPPSHQLTGEQRTYLYLTAANTGFRASELYSLTPANFHFGEQPFVQLEARSAKNKKAVNQPISQDFAKTIRPWLSRQDGRLWTQLACKRAAEMLTSDLDRAKISCNTREGLVDFHSLRVFYVTQLCKTIKNPKMIQTLARHSTMELTMKIYAKVNPTDAATAINGVQIGTKKLNKIETSRNKTKHK